MRSNLEKIENDIINNKKEIVDLRNKVEKKELEKKDQFLDLIRGIIELADLYETLLKGLVEKELDMSKDGGKCIRRFQSLYKEIQRLLKRKGVAIIEFPENQIIVGYTKIVDTEPDASRKDEEIISIVRNGYIYGKELIREAEVIAVKN